MAKGSRYRASKGDKVHKHIAAHHAAYAKNFKAAAKGVPNPGAPGHDAAWQQAIQAAMAQTAQDTGAGAGAPGPEGAPMPGGPAGAPPAVMPA